jgi:hypothetical protein
VIILAPESPGKARVMEESVDKSVVGSLSPLRLRNGKSNLTTNRRRQAPWYLEAVGQTIARTVVTVFDGALSDRWPSLEYPWRRGPTRAARDRHLAVTTDAGSHDPTIRPRSLGGQGLDPDEWERGGNGKATSIRRLLLDVHFAIQLCGRCKLPASLSSLSSLSTGRVEQGPMTNF